jgi:hypothetical protein
MGGSFLSFPLSFRSGMIPAVYFLPIIMRYNNSQWASVRSNQTLGCYNLVP